MTLFAHDFKIKRGQATPEGHEEFGALVRVGIAHITLGAEGQMPPRTFDLADIEDWEKGSQYLVLVYKVHIGDNRKDIPYPYPFPANEEQHCPKALGEIVDIWARYP